MSRYTRFFRVKLKILGILHVFHFCVFPIVQRTLLEWKGDWTIVDLDLPEIICVLEYGILDGRKEKIGRLHLGGEKGGTQHLGLKTLILNNEIIPHSEYI